MHKPPVLSALINTGTHLQGIPLLVSPTRGGRRLDFNDALNFYAGSPANLNQAFLFEQGFKFDIGSLAGLSELACFVDLDVSVSAFVYRLTNFDFFRLYFPIGQPLDHLKLININGGLVRSHFNNHRALCQSLLDTIFIRNERVLEPSFQGIARCAPACFTVHLDESVTAHVREFSH